MSEGWAIRVARANADALASLRRVEGIEILEHDSALWIRGPRADARLSKLLLGIPADDRFTLTAQQRLLPEGARIPGPPLPTGQWMPLSEWMRISSPESHGPASCSRNSCPLKLVRTGQEHPVTLLLTALSSWSAFTAEASAVRLRPLRFAVTNSGLVMIRGEPLPPLGGSRWVDHGGVAVPAGYTWAPAVAVEVLQRLFAVSPGSLVLWHEDGTISRIAAEQFVDASRSAVRLTQAASQIASEP